MPLSERPAYWCLVSLLIALPIGVNYLPPCLAEPSVKPPTSTMATIKEHRTDKDVDSNELFERGVYTCGIARREWTAGEVSDEDFIPYRILIKKKILGLRAAEERRDSKEIKSIKGEILALKKRLVEGDKVCKPGPGQQALNRLSLSSNAFPDGGIIPRMYTCFSFSGEKREGEIPPPPLAWSGVPLKTSQLVLLVSDVDDMDFAHWIVFINRRGAPGLKGLGAGASRLKSVTEKENDFGDTGYGAPCPPAGETHRYTFELFALRKNKVKDFGRDIRTIRNSLKRFTLAKDSLTGIVKGIADDAAVKVTPRATPTTSQWRRPTQTPTATHIPPSLIRATPTSPPMPTYTPPSLIGATPRPTPTLTPRPTPNPSTNTAVISAGGNHTCARLSSGGVKCWGWNSSGQIGVGSTGISVYATPVFVSEQRSGVREVVSGNSHTCSLLSTGSVRCWGDNLYGQIGDGSRSDRLRPVAVTALPSDVVKIAAGAGHTCALLSSGAAKCWGHNYSGQIGDGTEPNERLTPTQVSGLTDSVAQIACGGYHTCARLSTGGVKCWGSNRYGQVGDGTHNLRSSPTNVVGLSTGVVDITAGEYHTCALLRDGSVRCWGYNSSGQLGDDSYTERLTPVNVADLATGVISVSAGRTHTCALLENGVVKCWGDNFFGQIGNGPPVPFLGRLRPVTVAGLGNEALKISAGGDHTCALLDSGLTKCWGSNIVGELGDGSIALSRPPVTVAEGER